jgi:hypothetical protein
MGPYCFKQLGWELYGIVLWVWFHLTNRWNLCGWFDNHNATLKVMCCDLVWKLRLKSNVILTLVPCCWTTRFNHLVRKDMDVNGHERLFNIRLGHKFKKTSIAFIDVLHFTITVGSSTMGKIHTLKWVWNSP